jgi:hypothetical protein
MLENSYTKYKVVAANLDIDGVVRADRVATALKGEGWPNATRSLVIREALERLWEDLSDKTPEEVFEDFIRRRGRRLGRPVGERPAMCVRE